MMNKMCMAAIIAASLYAGTTFAQPAAVKGKSYWLGCI